MIDYSEMRIYQINYKNGFSPESIINMIKSNINIYFTEEFYDNNINLEYLFAQHKNNDTCTIICNIIILSSILGYKEDYLSNFLAKKIAEILKNEKFNNILPYDITKKAMQIYCSNFSIRDFVFVSLVYKISKYIEINELEITLSEYLSLKTNIYILTTKKLTIITDKVYKITKADFSNFKYLEELTLAHTGYEIILPNSIKKLIAHSSVNTMPILNISDTKLTHLTAHSCAIIGKINSFVDIIELDITNSCLSLLDKIVKLDITNINIKKLICNNQITGFENHSTLEYLDVRNIYSDNKKIAINSSVLKELRLYDINVVVINTPNLEKLVLDRINIESLVLPNLTELYMMNTKCIACYAPMVKILSTSENINIEIFYKVKTLGLSKKTDNSWVVFNSYIKQQIEKLYLNVHEGTLDLTNFATLKELHIKHADKIILQKNIKVFITNNDMMLKGTEKNMCIDFIS